MRKALLVLAVCIFATVSSSFALTGSGTAADPYQVTTAADLTSVGNDLTAYYELANDITAEGAISGAFTGVFDGKGNTVTVTESLFEWNQGTITDLDVAADISVAEGVTGTAIGGIVASNNGTISGCSVSGSIATGYGNYVGAIAGETNGLIEWCSTDATITVSDAAFASALDMDNMTLVGGIAGYAYTGAEIVSVDSEAAVTVNAQQAAVGGVVGYAVNALVTDAIYATGTVSTPYSLFTGMSVGGIVGYALESDLAAVTLDASASVIGGRLADAGGIAGYADASAISEATSAGSVMVGYFGYAGGIAGRSSSAVTNSYAAGTVSSMETYGVNAVLGGIIGLAEGASALTNVHNNSIIADNAGGAYAGTVYGWNASSTEAGAYYNSELAMGNATAGYGDAATATALTIAGMATQASFTAFNFADVWEMATSYPVLQNAPVLGDTPGVVQTRFEYTLSKGYNWISFPILPEDTALATVIAEYTAQATNLDQINSASGKLAQYYGGAWYGTLITVEAGKMYTVKVSSETDIVFGVDGLPVDDTKKITLVSGWNWIGSTLQTDITVENAFANMTLTNLDQVNSPDGKIAQYYNGAWYGSLLTIEPGVGYKLKVSEAQELFFDGALAAGAKKAASDLLPAAATPNWGEGVNVTDQYSMQVNCYFQIGGEQIATSSDSVLSVWTPTGDRLLGYDKATGGAGVITSSQFSFAYFYDNVSASGMTLRLYDGGTGKFYYVNDTIDFVNNGEVGTIIFPQLFTDLTEMPSYTVTFDAGVKGSVTDGDAVQTVYEDQDATAPTVTANSGWEFTGWDLTYTHITQDTTVTALYQASQVTQYTVTFDAGANGAITAGNAVQTVDEGASATAPTVTAAFGYVFAGWDADFDNITSDVTINALYDIATYRVEFVAGTNGSITAGTAVQTISHGQAATAPTVTPAAGYNFTGWDTDFSSVTSDLTVTAQYSVITFTVTFDAGNGTVTAGQAVQTVDYGTSAVAPTVTPATGFNFTGWDVAFDNVTSDLTVTAQYSAITFTVTFVAGADGTITEGQAVQTVDYGSSATAPTVTPNTGKVFDGWDIDFSNVTSDLTVTAQYSVITFTVTFDAGANGSITAGQATQVVNYGAAAVAPTITASNGWTFTGWDVDFSNVTSDLTVTALYEEATGNTFTVTFVAGVNGTITAGEATQEVDENGSAIAPTITAATGWNFDGWDIAFNSVTSDLTVTAQYSVATYTVTFVAGDNGSITAGNAVQTVTHADSASAPVVTANTGWQFVDWDTDYSNVTSDLTVTAIYSIKKYTVMFQAGAHGSITAGTASQVIEHGSAATAPTITADTGWDFTGWDADFSSVTSALTVTAQYSVTTFTVTFDAGNGTVTAGNAVQTVDYGTSAVAPTVTPAAGFNFTGWDVAFDNVTSDLTVTAQYSIITLTVTFNAGANGEITAGVAQQTVNYGTAATAPTITADTGWTFTGWDVAFSNVTSDITVTAVYSAIPQYTVTFNAGTNGTVISGASQTVYTGEGVELPMLVPDNGYEFMGWFDGSLQYQASDFDSITADITVTAQYQAADAPTKYSADFNNDRYIGSADLGVIANSWLYALDTLAADTKASAFTGDVFGDVDGNKWVGLGDYSVFGQYWLQTIAEQFTYDLSAGYSWISFNILPADTGVNSVLAGLVATDGDTITSQSDGYATYYNGSWWGNLATLKATEMYVLKLASATVFTASGDVVSADTAITLENGWNWVGFTSQTAMNVTDAFASLTLFDGDQIKSSAGKIAEYYQGDWYGTLDTLEPGAGYRVRMALPQTFAYSGTPAPQVAAAAPTTWVAPVGMEFNMTLYAEIQDDLGNQIATADGSVLSAWATNGDCLGVVSEVTAGPTGSLFAMTIWNDADDSSEVVLKAYDAATAKYYNVNDTVVFVDGDIEGSVFAPTVFASLEENTNGGGIPTWIAPVGTEFSMTLYAQVEDALGAQIATADGSMLSAWNSTGSIAGVVSEVTTGPVGQLFAMTIFGDVNPASGYTLKVYDALSDKTYDLNASIDFNDGDILGSVVSPQVYTVTGESNGGAPSWVAPTGMEFSMTLYAQVEDTLGAQIATADGSMLSAWNSTGAIAGVVSEVTTGPVGQLFAMTIFGDATPESGYTLKVYDVATDTTYDLDASIDFADGDVLGSIIAPQVYTVSGSSGEAPGWTAPTGLEFSMSMYVQIEDQLGAQIATANGSMLSAWSAAGSIAGVVKEVSDGPNGKLFLLMVFGNNASANGYGLKVFDGATGTTYVIDDTFDFADGTTIGSVVVPQVYTATGTSTGGGEPVWIAPTGKQYSMTLYAEIQDAEGVQIATADGSMFSAWTSDGLIAGVVDSVTTGPNGQLFAITIWNDVTPDTGIVLKAYDAAADTVYTIDTTIDFTDGNVLGSVIAPIVFSATAGDTTTTAPDWTHPTGQELYMLVYAQVVDQNGTPVATTSGSMLSAWTLDGSCSGVVNDVTWGPNGYFFNMLIASNESPVEQMRFKVYDAATGMVYNVIETIDFVDGSSVGQLWNPQEYTLTVMNYYAVSFEAGAHGAITAGDTAMWVEEGAAATAPTITADSGYAFDGWDAALTNVQSDMTITAQYTLASYIVLFDAGDHGTITAGSALQSVVYGFPASEPTVTVESGYTFTGWDVAFDNITSDLTVTAQYTQVFQDGSVAAPWLIYDANDWKNKLLAAGSSGDNFTVTGTVDLTGAAVADIVLSEPFTGTISGGGTIKYALDGTGLDYVALIPVANGATITNITFDVTVTGNNVVAGVIAYSADSLLENVTVTGTVTGNKYVGSLVGENRGTIRNCTSSASVTGNEVVGGLVGTNRGLIEGSTFTGSGTAPASARYVGEIAGANISGIIR